MFYILFFAMMNKKRSLPLQEWALIFVFMGLFLSIGVISWHSSRGSSKIVLEKMNRTQPIIIEVRGAVKRPSVYEVPWGSPVKKLFRLAGLDNNADTKKWHPKERLYESAVLTIPSIEEIKVYFEGAVVEAGSLVVPWGTRICDLKDLIPLAEKADRRFFYKKKRLKDRERISIPFRGKSTENKESS
jgi:hypothetical protein